MIEVAIEWNRQLLESKILYDFQIELQEREFGRTELLVTLGRENYHFCQSSAGALAAARIYGVTATAKANDLPLANYLTHLIEKFPYVKPLEDFEVLLPLR